MVSRLAPSHGTTRNLGLRLLLQAMDGGAAGLAWAFDGAQVADASGPGSRLVY